MKATNTTLLLEIQLRSPTCIAQRPIGVGQPAETLGFLSGTVLRGAIAAQWLLGRRYAELQDTERELFRRIFLDGQVVFGNGWPIPERGRPRVVPRTAWTDKRNGGWYGDRRGEGVVDVLTRLLRADDDEQGALPEGYDRLDQEFAADDRGGWNELPVRRRLLTRTALTATLPHDQLPSVRRGVGLEGQLYSFEALETGQRFRASVSGPAELIDALREEHAIAPDMLLSIGQGRSRGLGQAHVSSVDIHSADDAAREERSGELLAEQAEAFTERAGHAGGQVLLPVTLESDALLRDRFLLPTTLPDPADALAETAAGSAPADMSLYQVVQSHHWIGGWEEVRRLPRSPQIAIQQGSVWVYQVPRASLAAAVAWWMDAEQLGIGERVAEGYGRVRLLHPLHAEEREAW